MLSLKLNIKPLSVNEAWKGKRKRSDKYNAYRKLILHALKRKPIEKDQELFIFLEFGFSSRGSDYDNPIKPIQDIISEKYGFNDNQIYLSVTKKTIVKKGEEFIRIKIIPLETIAEKVDDLIKSINI